MTNEALMCFNIFCSLVAFSEVMARSFNQEDWCLLVVIWQCTLSSKISTCQSSKKNPDSDLSDVSIHAFAQSMEWWYTHIREEGWDNGFPLMLMLLAV